MTDSSLLFIPAKNTQFLPWDLRRFCIDTRFCPVVTKSSKMIMSRWTLNGGLLRPLGARPSFEE